MSLAQAFRAAFLVLVATAPACRGKTAPARSAMDWKTAAALAPEKAALLIVGADGAATVACLPGPVKERRRIAGATLGLLADASSRRGLRVVGWVDAPSIGATDNEAVLLSESGEPRRIAKGVRSARFSPDGDALAYQVAAPEGPGEDTVATFVLDLDSGKVSDLGPLADPLWEADGKHLRATRLPTAEEAHRTPPVAWKSLRARWDRESHLTTTDGPGSAQIPAPVGNGVAWTEEPRNRNGRSPCAVYLEPRGGVRHSVEGAFCRGVADDRGVRWSADGAWLAFAHPAPHAAPWKKGDFFIDVVSVAGGRAPALAALHETARPQELAIATTPASVWLDWSPSGRFLALHDGAGDLHVYDFQAHGVASLGKGQRPTWSPAGSYLLVLSREGEALVLGGTSPEARLSLGKARDARWLAPEACSARSPT